MCKNEASLCLHVEVIHVELALIRLYKLKAFGTFNLGRAIQERTLRTKSSSHSPKAFQVVIN